MCPGDSTMDSHTVKWLCFTGLAFGVILHWRWTKQVLCILDTIVYPQTEWVMVMERYSNVEKPTVVSLVRQLSRLQLGEEEKLHEYFIRSQELMSRLSEAGEQVSETLFNALVINGLPGKYEHFVVQESFNPASTFTELRTRLQNYEDSRMQRKQTEDNLSEAVYSANKHGQGRNTVGL